MRFFSRCSLIATALMLALAPLARAVPVTVDFTGKLDAFGGTFAGLTSGQSFSGSFTYESTTPDIAPGDPAGGLYIDTITAFSLSIGSFNATLVTPGLADLLIDNSASGDGFHLAANSTSNAVGGRTLQEVHFVSYTGINTTFTSDALPGSGAFPTINFPASGPTNIVNLSFSGGFVFGGRLDTLSAHTTAGVPDSGATAGLIALACLGLAAVRRRSLAA